VFTPLILSLMVANNMAASAAIFVAWQISTLRAPRRRQAAPAAPKDDDSAKIFALDVAFPEAA
jgi:hypothetical protein